MGNSPAHVRDARGVSPKPEVIIARQGRTCTKRLREVQLEQAVSLLSLPSWSRRNSARLPQGGLWYDTFDLSVKPSPQPRELTTRGKSKLHIHYHFNARVWSNAWNLQAAHRREEPMSLFRVCVHALPSRLQTGSRMQA